LRSNSPGVLLFRLARADSALESTLAVAYLVGETPTSGIHQEALDSALAERASLGGRTSACPLPSDARHGGPASTDRLRLVGPSFSGSIPSLRHALHRWLAGDRTRSVTIVTGSANAPGNRNDLEAGSNGRISFSSTMLPIDVLITTLCDSVL